MFARGSTHWCRRGTMTLCESSPRGGTDSIRQPDFDTVFHGSLSLWAEPFGGRRSRTRTMSRTRGLPGPRRATLPGEARPQARLIPDAISSFLLQVFLRLLILYLRVLRLPGCRVGPRRLASGRPGLRGQRDDVSAQEWPVCSEVQVTPVHVRRVTRDRSKEKPLLNRGIDQQTHSRLDATR